jgi:hypothetical protein
VGFASSAYHGRGSIGIAIFDLGDVRTLVASL